MGKTKRPQGLGLDDICHQSNMQTKRLHISGLTPAISEKDIASRFSVFGNVKAVHGVGQLNAVGQPRNFAFVSLEATPEKITKCMPSSFHVFLFCLTYRYRPECSVRFDLERDET
jgi:hypothetical protein